MPKIPFAEELRTEIADGKPGFGITNRRDKVQVFTWPGDPEGNVAAERHVGMADDAGPDPDVAVDAALGHRRHARLRGVLILL